MYCREIGDEHYTYSSHTPQVGGIRFLYDNIVESLDRHNSSDGFGCILAHSMGLGKTLQVIAFIDLYLRHTSAERVMCVVPVNTLQNWITEFDMWLPISKGIGEEGVEVRPRNFVLFTLNESVRSMDTRFETIDNWFKMGGVLLVGYEMYRLLSLSVPSIGGNKMATKRKKPMPRAEPGSHLTIDLDETEKEMDALIGELHVIVCHFVCVCVSLCECECLCLCVSVCECVSVFV